MDTVDLTSFARMSFDWDVSYRMLQRAVIEAGVRPALRMNNIEYYDSAAVDAIKREVNKRE